jgi:hypothetical protein
MLTAQNRHHDALAIANQAVQILKRLALTEPDTHEPDLAQSLNNLSVLLTVLGRHSDALAAADQSVQIRRRLARANPAVHEPDLAQSLMLLTSARLNTRHQAPFAAIKEACGILRRQNKPSAAFETNLTTALSAAVITL